MTTKQISDRLNTYSKISGIVLLLFGVTAILSSKFAIPSYFETCTRPWEIGPYASCLLDGARRLVAKEALPLLLAGVTVLWFFLYDWAIKTEKSLLDTILLAPAIDRQPKRIKGEYLVVLLAAAIPSLFLLLAWMVDRLAIYCFLVVLLNLGDLVGNNIVRENLAAYIRDGDKAATSSPNRNIYFARRRVAEWYWLQRPHIGRISLHLCINCAALFIATNQPAQLGMPIDQSAAYVLVALGIVVNESTIGLWRYVRHRKLAHIARQEEAAIRAAEN